MPESRPPEAPLCMVFCDRQGRVYDDPELAMAGANGPAWRAVAMEDTIPLPDGSTISPSDGTLPRTSSRPARVPRASGG